MTDFRDKHDTPRTDALLLTINEGRTYKDEGPVVDLARKLERALAEAKEHAEYEQNRADGAVEELKSALSATAATEDRLRNLLALALPLLEESHPHSRLLARIAAEIPDEAPAPDSGKADR